MAFEKFGIKSFVKETKAEQFVTYLEQSRIMTTRCKKCNNISFPPKLDCAACRASDMEWVELNEPGKLITFTTVMYGPAGFESQVPYTVGVIHLADEVNILGIIDKNIPTEEIKVGIELKVVPIELPDGRLSYQFEKI